MHYSVICGHEVILVFFATRLGIDCCTILEDSVSLCDAILEGFSDDSARVVQVKPGYHATDH